MTELVFKIGINNVEYKVVSVKYDEQAQGDIAMIYVEIDGKIDKVGIEPFTPIEINDKVYKFYYVNNDESANSILEFKLSDGFE